MYYVMFNLFMVINWQIHMCGVTLKGNRMNTVYAGFVTLATLAT